MIRFRNQFRLQEAFDDPIQVAGIEDDQLIRMGRHGLHQAVAVLIAIGQRE